MNLTSHFPIIYPSGMHKESFTFMMRWKSHCPLHAEKIKFFKKYIFSLSCIMPRTFLVENSSSVMCILNAYSHVSPCTEKQ